MQMNHVFNVKAERIITLTAANVIAPAKTVTNAPRAARNTIRSSENVSDDDAI